MGSVTVDAMKRLARIVFVGLGAMAMLLSVQSSSAVEDESSWPSPWPPVEDLEFPPPTDWLPLPPGEDRAMPGIPNGPEIYPGFSLSSEEHTSELQSRFDLVCRHLL